MRISWLLHLTYLLYFCVLLFPPCIIVKVLSVGFTTFLLWTDDGWIHFRLWHRWAESRKITWSAALLPPLPVAAAFPTTPPSPQVIAWDKLCRCCWCCCCCWFSLFRSWVCVGRVWECSRSFTCGRCFFFVNAYIVQRASSNLHLAQCTTGTWALARRASSRPFPGSSLAFSRTTVASCSGWFASPSGWRSAGGEGPEN